MCVARCSAGMVILLALVSSSCVTGGGASLGLYADTRGDLGVAVRGHANALGFRLADTPDTEPAGAPLLGIEMGPAFSFKEDFWRLQVGVPLGAGTWDDTNAGHGVRIAPQFQMDYAWRYGGAPVHEAYGGGVEVAYLSHVTMESEHYDGPDAIRLHRVGPMFTASFLRDDKGWFGNFLLAVMWDYEAYVATGR